MPIPPSEKVEKNALSKQSPLLSDKISPIATNGINKSMLTQSLNPQNPPKLPEPPLNAKVLEPKEMSHISELAQQVGLTKEGIKENSEKPNGKKADHIGDIKLVSAKSKDYKKFFNDKFNKVNKDEGFFKILGPNGKVITQKTLKNYKNKEELFNEFKDCSGFAFVEKEGTHWFGDAHTAEHHRQLAEVEASDDISPKLRALLGPSQERTHYHHSSVNKEEFLSALSTAIEQFFVVQNKKEGSEKTEEKSKEHVPSEVAIHHYTSNFSPSIPIKNIVILSFKGIDGVVKFTLTCSEMITKNINKSNKKAKEELDLRVKQENRSDEIKHDETKHDESNRNSIRDTLKLRYTQVIEAMGKTPDITKPSQTI